MPTPLAVYVHWPFCLSKCPYCDFNSHVRETVDQAAWREALVSEIAYEAARLPGRTVTSVFFGGGTPSLMPPATVGAVLEAIAHHWVLEDGAEVTLEANPTSSEVEKFKAFAAAGIHRVSLGVQALEADVLRFLGRTHSAEHALRAVEMAATHFPRYSFDLIYARPGQTPENWEAELRRALAYAGDHLSLYQLTIEPGTAFYHAHARGELQEIDEETAAELYLVTQTVMESAGLPAYEISNHARPGGESRHNLAYWRYQDYVGIGPGAHGRITCGNKKLAPQGLRSPEAWLRSVQQYGHGRESETAISLPEQQIERLLMGLRLNEGISAILFEQETGAPLISCLEPQAMHDLQQAGWLDWREDRLRVTGEGRLKLNAILARLVKSSG